MHLQVLAPIAFTEDPERVAKAVRFLGPTEVEIFERSAIGRVDSLDRLRSLIWEREIIDTMRGRLLQSDKADGTIEFRLSKMAAYAGQLNLPVDEHPLGDLIVTIDPSPYPYEQVIGWLCPETAEGHIVGEPPATVADAEPAALR